MNSANWVARVVKNDGSVVIAASQMTEHWARTWLATNLEDKNAEAEGLKFEIWRDLWGSREVLSGL